MIPMLCTKDLVYAGRRLKPGAAFNARGESDARLLTAIGKAKRAPAPTPLPAAPAPVPARASVTPAPIATEPDPVSTPDAPAVDAATDDIEASTQGRQKRTYRRRDLLAE